MPCSNLKFSALILSATMIATPLAATAQAQEITTPTIQQETTLNLTGNGKVDFAPDIATISLGVQVEEKTAALAMAEQSRRMNGVFAALKKAGVSQKDMQTGNLSLHPRYNYRSKDNAPPTVTGYQASNSVSVIVRDLGKLGKTVDATVNAGGNTINSVSFGLADSSEALKLAREAAVKDALDKAELYASASGYSVSRIITINESGASRPYPQPVMMEARMAVSDAAPTPVAAGEVSYSSQVNVSFELAKAD